MTFAEGQVRWNNHLALAGDRKRSHGHPFPERRPETRSVSLGEGTGVRRRQVEAHIIMKPEGTTTTCI